MPSCFVTNNAFTLRPNDRRDFYWLYHALKQRGLDDVIGGSAQPQITLDGVSKVELTYPSPELRGKFGAHAAPLFELSWNLAAQNQRLRLARDLLLPKLISGEFEVSAAEGLATAAE